MKNYGHIWQWGTNPEYTIDVCVHWRHWALPLTINWSISNILHNKCRNIGINFLCFHFSIEIWRWKNDT